jgi:hypothetical protein
VAGEATNAIAGGNAAGGVGVVRLTISNGGVLPSGKPDGFFCTGTIISSDRIITAGHCVNTWLTIKDHRDTTVLLQGDLMAGAEHTEDGTSFSCLSDPSSPACAPSMFVPVHVTRLGNGQFPPDVAVLRFATPFQGIRRAEFRQLSTGSVRVKQALEVWGSGFTDSSATAGATLSEVMRRAVVRVASVSATQLEISNSVSQLCLGDSGGPFFAGPSDLIAALMSQGLNRGGGGCELSIDQSTATRITPAVIDLINNNRGPSDPLCHETIAGSGFQACF